MQWYRCAIEFFLIDSECVLSVLVCAVLCLSVSAAFGPQHQKQYEFEHVMNSVLLQIGSLQLNGHVWGGGEHRHRGFSNTACICIPIWHKVAPNSPT